MSTVVPLGSRENPLSGSRSDIIAKAIAAAFSQGPFPGLIEYRRNFWRWHEDRWVWMDYRGLEDLVIKWIMDSYYIAGYEEDGSPIIKRLPPTNHALVVRILRSFCVIPNDSPFPYSALTECNWNPGTTIAFSDCLVDVGGEEIRTYPRPPSWVDPQIFKFPWGDGKAECPTWEKCLQQWSNGDPTWIALLERYMGYCLMGTRKYARALLQYGKIRSGKGTATRILRHLQRHPNFISIPIESIINDFGLDGLEVARTLVIPELHQLDKRSAESLSSLIKTILGEDVRPVNIKHERRMNDLILRSAIIIQANELPNLPDRGTGVSSKLLPLCYQNSFLGKEDMGLEDRLLQELPGIARRLAKAAWELERTQEPSEKLPLTEDARAAINDYRSAVNPLDSFLETYFTKDPKGAKGNFIASEVIRSLFATWRKVNKIKLDIPDNYLNQRLEQDTSWDIKRYRKPNGGSRGMRGLFLKLTPENT